MKYEVKAKGSGHRDLSIQLCKWLFGVLIFILSSKYKTTVNPQELSSTPPATGLGHKVY